MKKSKSDLIIIASAKASPGKVAELERALLEASGPTRAQPGCVSFGTYSSVDDPAVIIGLERWASEEEHERHLQGPHVKPLMSRMVGILAEPPKILSYRVIDED